MGNLEDDMVYVLTRVSALDSRLGADTWRCHSAIVHLNEGNSSDSMDIKEHEFWLRTFLRVFFAQVEGLSFSMREATVFLAKQGHISLHEGALTVLEEKRYKSRDGKVEPTDSFNTTIENFLLAFHYFPRAFGAEYMVAKGDARWVAFKNSLALRNRMTHPKSSDDLDLTGDNVLEFSHAFKWFTEQVIGCFSAVGEQLSKAVPEQPDGAPME